MRINATGRRWFEVMRIFPIVFTLLSGAGQLCAQLEPDGANDTNYVLLGSQYTRKTVWVQGISTTTGNPVGASGILLDPCNVLAAAHFATGVDFTGVGNGANQLTAPGTAASVSSVVVYPGYVNNGQFNSPDIAILHLSAPLGNTIQNIAAVSQGQSVVLTGFGFHGTPSGGIFYDGALRGWTGVTDNNGMPGNVSTLYYDNVDWPGNSSMPANTLGGSSGGGVYDANGDLVGMVEAQNGGTGQIGGQQFLDFAKSGVESWIATNLTPYLVFNTAGTNLVLQWNGSFVLQSSTNLTAGFADITNAASPYTNAMIAPQMFFRLRSPP